MDLRVGDIAVPMGGGFFLSKKLQRSYRHAVVVSVQPLVLVPPDCGELWRGLRVNQVESLGAVAGDELLQKACTLYQKESQQPPPTEICNTPSPAPKVLEQGGV